MDPARASYYWVDVTRTGTWGVEYINGIQCNRVEGNCGCCGIGIAVMDEDEQGSGTVAMCPVLLRWKNTQGQPHYSHTHPRAHAILV